jgi:phospholipase C
MTFPDPKHELENVRRQLREGGAQFVLDYATEYPEDTDEEKRGQIMGYYAPGFLPATHTLARSFAICDHWFSSVPGPTWPNRLFLLSGTSQGRVKMPESVLRSNLHLYNQDTIFDRLNEKQISWRVYHGDFPLSLLFTHQLSPENLRWYDAMEEFFAKAAGPAAEFPSFAFIEPDYLGDDANDNHPPHDILKGEQLIASVYNTLRANTELWNSTLLVLLYDEHGGFYDHVKPPAAVAPDDDLDEFDFDRLGVRVPALLISPWIDQQVVKTEFDHTSLLKYLIEKWGLGLLGERTAAANSFGAVIRTSGNPRTDVPEPITVSKPRGTPISSRVLTDNERAIRLYSQQLDTRSLARPDGVVGRVARAMRNSPNVRDDVRQELARFLARNSEHRQL